MSFARRLVFLAALLCVVSAPAHAALLAVLELSGKALPDEQRAVLTLQSGQDMNHNIQLPPVLLTAYRQSFLLKTSTVHTRWACYSA